MNTLNKAIRAKRFKVRPESKVQFIIETKLGTQHSLKLENCSLTGLGAKADFVLTQADGFDSGEIIPAAKLSWEGHEYTLGRLVLRSFKAAEGSTYLGFSCVDSKVPVDGPLSKHIDISLDQTGSIYDYELGTGKFSLASFVENEANNVDLFSKCRQFSVYHQEWHNSSRYLYDASRLPSKGVRVKLGRPRKNGRNDYIIMGSNDYLGLSSHPKVIEAAKKALDEYGFGSTGSPVSTGNTKLHEELCEHLSRIFKKEKTILYNSGYAANVGALTGITTARDFVAADILSHASIQDALQMSNATSRFFKHNDVNHLEKILEEHRSQFAGALVVTEGVFSMDGDVAKLDSILKTADKYQARTFVDEAHSFGVIGPTGLGVCEKYGVLDKVDMIMGTFSKICGGIGGFISTSKDVADWLHYYSRAHVFSVTIPPSTAAAALTSLKLFQEDRELLENLRRNIQHFIQGLNQIGFSISTSHESSVVPVVIGDEEKLGQMLQILLEAGIFVIPVVYPAVSRKSCRFRFTVMATHTTSDLDYVINTIERAMAEAKFEPSSLERLNSDPKKAA